MFTWKVRCPWGAEELGGQSCLGMSDPEFSILHPSALQGADPHSLRRESRRVSHLSLGPETLVLGVEVAETSWEPLGQTAASLGLWTFRGRGLALRAQDQVR